MRGYLKFATKNPVLVGWIVYVILTSVTVAFSLWMFNVEKRNAMYDVERRSLEVRENLEAALTNSIIATSMIAYLVEKDIIQDNFDSLSRDLLDQYTYIDALQLLKGTTIVNTYPIEGNESTLGFDISTNRSHVLESMKSIARNQLYFEGPFNLRQGGVGIVGRRPIYQNGELWGFTSVVIRSETLIAATGVDQTGLDDKYQYQITKLNADSTQTNLFNHEKPIDNDIYYSSFLPIGDWNVIVKARYPVHLLRATPIFILGLLLSLVIGVMAWFMASEPKKLERLVHEKTESLESALFELEDQRSRLLVINAELKQFAFVASHDLQEPLRMISSFLSKLDQNYSSKLDDKARKYIQFAVDGSNRMRTLIIDLLEYSQVGETISKLELVDLNEVIKEVKHMNRDLITARSAIVTSDNLPLINGYRIPLIQMFSNLIQNSIKYAKEGFPPHIEIIASETKSAVEIKVADNGIGIESEFFEKIFIIFQRLHSTSEYSGTGIGLAIVKKVVDMHNGTIQVESTPGIGTTFCLSLKKSTERHARIQA